MCVQCDVCIDTEPPVLSPIREDKVIYSKSLTQEDCSIINADSGNQTSAPVQALDQKFNSLPLGNHVGHTLIQRSFMTKIDKIVWLLRKLHLTHLIVGWKRERWYGNLSYMPYRMWRACKCIHIEITTCHSEAIVRSRFSVALSQVVSPTKLPSPSKRSCEFDPLVDGPLNRINVRRTTVATKAHLQVKDIR